MNEKQNIALDKAFSEFGISKSVLIGNKKLHPQLFKKRICELKRMGVAVQLLSQKFQLNESLIYKWYYLEQKNLKESSLKPKQLKIKKDVLHPKLRKSDIVEALPKTINARLIFKSGIQLELPIVGMDRHFLILWEFPISAS